MQWLQWVVLAVLASAGLIVHFNLPAERHVRGAARWIGGWMRANPASAVLLVLVTYHALLLATMPDRLDRAILISRSSNLGQLARDPFGSLLWSALWTHGVDTLGAIPLIVLVLAPAERWLGTLRAVVAFWIGHIVATLLVAVILQRGVDVGIVVGSTRRAVDVGVSYGAMTLAALLVYRLPVRWRLVVFVGGLVVLRIVAAVNQTFTDVGHFIAFVIGMLLYPLTWGTTVAARRATRWVRVPPIDPAASVTAKAGAGPPPLYGDGP